MWEIEHGDVMTLHSICISLRSTEATNERAARWEHGMSVMPQMSIIDNDAHNDDNSAEDLINHPSSPMIMYQRFHQGESDLFKRTPKYS